MQLIVSGAAPRAIISRDTAAACCLVSDEMHSHVIACASVERHAHAEPRRYNVSSEHAAVAGGNTRRKHAQIASELGGAAQSVAAVVHVRARAYLDVFTEGSVDHGLDDERGGPSSLPLRARTQK